MYERIYRFGRMGWGGVEWSGVECVDGLGESQGRPRWNELR